MATTALPQVQTVTLTTGTPTEVTFEKWSGRYLVKNFSDGDIYVSFSADITNQIRIASGMGQVCIINERNGAQGQEKANSIFIEGNGDVEVQQLWY